MEKLDSGRLEYDVKSALYDARHQLDKVKQSLYAARGAIDDPDQNGLFNTYRNIDSAVEAADLLGSLISHALYTTSEEVK